MQHLIHKTIASTATILTLGENRLSILIFHRVLEAFDFMRPDEITAKDFDRKMQLIARYYTPLPLSEAIEMLKQGALPKRAICVTFDDGYRDNAEVALPVLKSRQVPATFFVATGFLDGGRMWNDTVIETVRAYPKDILDLTELGLGLFNVENSQQREKSAQTIIQKIKHFPQDERAAKVEVISSLVASLPNNLMMETQQVKQLSESGMEIGGHTVTHPILATLTSEKAEEEISEGKKVLESIIQNPISLFAYPNGKPGQDYLPEHISIVKKLGFKAAVSTNWGVSNSKSDMYQLKRFTPWDQLEAKFLLRLIKNSLVIN